MISKAKGKKGSSTVEYLLLFAAIISILIVFARPSGPLTQVLNYSLDSTAAGMVDMSLRLRDSTIAASPDDPLGASNNTAF